MLGSAGQEYETHKEKASAEGSGYLHTVDHKRSSITPSGSGPFFLQQSFTSVRIEKRRKESNSHLHMSLLEFSLNLVTLPNVEIGLDGGYRGRTLFTIPTECGFVLDIHGGRSRGVGA